MAKYDFGPARVDFSAIGNLGQAFFEPYDKAKKQSALDALGRDVEARNYGTAAVKALHAGNTELAKALIGYEEKRRELAQKQGLLSGGAGGNAASTPAPAPSRSPAPGRPDAPLSGDAAQIENRFVSTINGEGLTNPFGLGAAAAYGRAESGFSPHNVTRVWNDPSESGQPGRSGGIMSWRNERLDGMKRFAQERGENPHAPSVETQALFLARENPQLVSRLQAARSNEEANQIMANAWRFAGYDRAGGENARRLDLTRQYSQRYATGDAPTLTMPELPPQASAPAAQGPVQPGANIAAAPYGPATDARSAAGQGLLISETQKTPLVDDLERERIDKSFLNGIYEAGPKISQRLADMDTLSAAVRDLPAGRLSSRRVVLDRIGAAIGLSPGDLAAGSDEIDATVARLVPAEREEGANSTSGIEFKRMLGVLPGLAATQEGRQLIQSTIARQSKLQLRRAEVAEQWEAGSLRAREARRLIAQIDRTSMFGSQEEKALFRKLTAAATGSVVSKREEPMEQTVGGKTYIRRNGDWYPKEDSAHGAAGH